MKNWDATYLGWDWTNMKVPDFTIFRGKGVKGSIWYWNIPADMSHEIYPFSSIFVEGTIVEFCSNYKTPTILENKIVIGPEFPSNPGSVNCVVSSNECLFYCISKASKDPLVSYPVNLNRGDEYVVNKDHVLFIAKGSADADSVAYQAEDHIIATSDLKIVAKETFLGICIEI